MLYFCTMSRLLAIDYGQKRVGIAVTDDEQIIASALATLHSKEVMSFLKDYLSKEEVECFVVGLAKNLDKQQIKDNIKMKYCDHIVVNNKSLRVLKKNLLNIIKLYE